MELKEEIKEYFEDIRSKTELAYSVSKKAKKQGYDPEETVIPLAKNMAERVEGLISAVAPQIVGKGLPKRISELEKKYGFLDWRVALTIAEEVTNEKFCKFEGKLEAMEIGIRVGFAYITMGTVASPLEGFIGIKLKKTRDNKEYFDLQYSGPIRSAGGTGASVSVLIADYIRKKMGYSKYDPSEEEIKRTVTELYDYHERVTNLQYLPSKEEIEFLARNIPVQIGGDPSEKIEVSNYKDLPRIETNRIRSGVCLIMGEGMAQKAPKLFAKIAQWGKDFDLGDWNFMEEFLTIQKKVKSKGASSEGEKISPIYTYISDIVAGRPVLTHPMRAGGFRLRYGRSRTSGYSAASIHPSTMAVLNNYIAIGTQLKLERPGKGAAVTSCDTIDPPIVKLNNGSVVRLDEIKEAKKLFPEIKEILFLGDILINYGDFFNRAHPLIPFGHCEEYWVQELEKSIVDTFGALDVDKLSELTEIDVNILKSILKNPLKQKVTADQALTISEKLNMSLHPRYSYYFNTISSDDLAVLAKYLSKANYIKEQQKIVLPFEEKPKRILEILGIPHIAVGNEHVVVEKEEAKILSYIFDNENMTEIIDTIEKNQEKEPLELVNSISKVKIKDKSGIFIGARMGRPEKAKMRKLTGSPHVLFPVGEQGGKMRCFQSALEKGKIKAEFPMYECGSCNKTTVFGICETCGKKTQKMYYCNVCGFTKKEKCPKHGQALTYKEQEIDIKEYFSAFMKKLGLKAYPDLIKGVRGTSNKDHVPEHLAKGILRARNDVFVNKDGTIRYDMSQLPITHFRPKEIRTQIEKLKELGYKKDINGEELKTEDQVLELKPQDIILPAAEESPDKGADEVLFNAANFVDELLEKLYGLDRFYNLKSKEDIVGHLAIALAPHTSAAIVTRIIGFSSTQVFFAHPMLHAATRRDCDGDEASITLLLDALINFSRSYLPSTRGATQDAPLVLTYQLTPSEVDDMIFDMDVAWKYPLEFYEACNLYKKPKDIKIDQVGNRLNTIDQYNGFGFTHNTTNINDGVHCSAYKLLPSMEEKLLGQMDLAEKIRAVDEKDVARLIIEKHFLPDIKGNLRKFSQQEFRCVGCNEKFRRPPLSGKCTKCNGKIIFTISKGSIIKYLEPSISLAKKYDLPPYLKQTLELTQRRVEDVFGRDKEKQEGLGKWFG